MHAGRPAKRAEDAFEIALLQRQQFGERFFAAFHVVGQNHLAHGDDAVAFEEHVLGAAEADAFGAESDGVFDLIGLVGIGAQTELAILVGQLHQRVVILEDFAFAGGERFADEHLLEFAVGGFDGTVEDFAGRAVDADGVAFAERDAVAR